MGYDSKAVRVKKAEKALAILCYNKELGRHLIKEFAAAEAKNTKARSARNRGDKDSE